MNSPPNDLTPTEASAAQTRYTKTHEWLKPCGDEFMVGITQSAQKELGDIVFIGGFEEVGTMLAQQDSVGTIESVKAASDIWMPVDGEIVAINESVQTDLDLIQTAAEDPDNWIFKIKATHIDQIHALLDANTYKAFAEEELKK